MRKGIFPEAINTVLQHYDIVEVVSNYVQLTKQGKYLKGLCPFHSEKTPSFTVTPQKQIFYCYGCHKGGDAIQFKMDIEGESFLQVVTRMAQEVKLPTPWVNSEPTDFFSPQMQQKQRLQEAYDYSAKLYHYILQNVEFSTPAKDYLKGRGLDNKLIEAFNIGYAPPQRETLVQGLDRKGFSLEEMEEGGLLTRTQGLNDYVDRFSNRIIFPISDYKGRLIAFAARRLDRGQPKYLNSPETLLFNKGHTLYRLFEARSEIRKAGSAVLFEGYMDVIKAYSAGIYNGVATMGTNLTFAQATGLRKYTEKVIVCYDGDEAGLVATGKAAFLLEQAGFHVLIGYLPQGLDPDEYISSFGAEKFKLEIIAKAISIIKFKLIYLRKSHILLEGEGQIQYLREAVQIIAKLNSPVEREMYLKELAQEFGVALDTLKQECATLYHSAERTSSKRFRDNPYRKGNNVRNDSSTLAISRNKDNDVGMAYLKAERHLLKWMLEDKSICDFVQKRIGSDFFEEEHTALVAYLYSFYSEQEKFDLGKFKLFLNNSQLIAIISEIILMDSEYLPTERCMEDFFLTIKMAFIEKEIVQKETELTRAWNEKNTERELALATEIQNLIAQNKKLNKVRVSKKEGVDL